jgi:hypothetical protein
MGGGSMRRLVLFLLLPIGAACVATRSYYVPDEAAYALEGTICGSVPWGRTRVPLGPDLSAALSIVPQDGRIGIGLQLALPKGTRVRLAGSEIGIADPGSGQYYIGRLTRFQVSVFGHDGQPGHHEYVDVTGLLEGKGLNEQIKVGKDERAQRDLFVSSAEILAKASPAMVLTFPPTEVNGILITPPPVPLHLIKKTGLMACVQ